MKTTTSILCLIILSGCIFPKHKQVVNPCSEKVDRLISIFENDFIEFEKYTGACLMSPIEDEIIDIVKNYGKCFKGVPNSRIFDVFPEEMKEREKVAGFDNVHQTFILQCYEDTIMKGVFRFRVFSNDELIDSLEIISYSDFRTNKTSIDNLMSPQKTSQ